METAENAEHRRNWQSVRTILQALTLFGIVYLGSTTKSNSETNIELKTQVSTMTEEIRGLRTQLDNMQTLSRDIAKHDVRLDEHERRIGTLEQVHTREILRDAK